MANDITLVFVHGWSVTNLNTYGELPIRLRNEGRVAGIDIDVRDIFLGQYISFHDEVRLPDISRAFQSAVNEQLGDIISAGRRFIAITHSTGGPVMRDWSERYKSQWPSFPMSHLIMLAPANFGSALAQLGKARISRLASWFQGVEPGQGVLDWLELGSNESWKLNKDWIQSDGSGISADHFFPFVLIGQAIDRKFYDNLNSYTGELGSDGVVRSAGANLNATYVLLKQLLPGVDNDTPVVESDTAPRTAFRTVRHASHSGNEMGIMASEKADVNDPLGADTVNAIIRCMQVATKENYYQLCDDFDNETAQLQQEEQLEIIEKGLIFRSKRYFIHDKYSMIIFRVCDAEGYPVRDYDLIFTSGPGNSPDQLPEGFFADRQRNSKNPETVTYYVNHDIMNGSPAIMDGDNVVRPAVEGVTDLGVQVVPRPNNGFVRYYPFELQANSDFFNKVVSPNSTTLIEICLQRLVDKNVFVLNGPVDAMTSDAAGDFKGIDPSGVNVG